jgi:hypothetical protein
VLTQYQTLTQQLLQNPGAISNIYTTAQLTNFINIARGQVAGEGECIRAIGTISTVVGQRSYLFSGINLGTVATTGIQGAINVQWIMYNVASGQKWIKGKAWQWFSFQRLNNPVPGSGPPTEWSQYSQGSAGLGSITGEGTGTINSGSFYIDPLPDIAYTLQCDCVCYPQALAADADVEAIPYLWTDAVPYFAAYMALMSSQASARLDQAQRLFALYEQFMARARNAATPGLNRYAYPQAQDPFKTGRLGSGSPQAVAGGGLAQ